VWFDRPTKDTAIEADSGVVSPKFWGWQNVRFEANITLFCVGHRILKGKMTTYAKNWGAWVLGLCLWRQTVTSFEFGARRDPEMN